jgi:anti-sigma regulatory factor (Ser/Thr protein kinase)
MGAGSVATSRVLRAAGELASRTVRRGAAHEGVVLMCRVLQKGLHRHPSSPACARHLLVDTLRTWDMQRPADLQDTAVLLVDELVTNAVLHAHAPARLLVAAANGTLEICVSDLSAGLPRRRQVPLPADGLSTQGRGLELLEALADDWGVVALSVGKQVWFRLQTPDWPWANACVCDGEELPRVRLGSGGYALAMPQPWKLPPTATEPGAV